MGLSRNRMNGWLMKRKVFGWKGKTDKDSFYIKMILEKDFGIIVSKC